MPPTLHYAAEPVTRESHHLRRAWVTLLLVVAIDIAVEFGTNNHLAMHFTLRARELLGRVMLLGGGALALASAAMWFSPRATMIAATTAIVLAMTLVVWSYEPLVARSSVALTTIERFGRPLVFAALFPESIVALAAGIGLWCRSAEKPALSCRLAAWVAVAASLCGWVHRAKSGPEPLFRVTNQMWLVSALVAASVSWRNVRRPWLLVSFAIALLAIAAADAGAFGRADPSVAHLRRVGRHALPRTLLPVSTLLLLAWLRSRRSKEDAAESDVADERPAVHNRQV